MNILITGASGFLGRHFIEACIKKGDNVYALVRNESSIRSLDFVKKNHIIVHDLMQPYADFDTIKNIKFDILYHFAWVGIKPEERNNYNIQKQNVEITKNVFTIMSKLDVKKVIFLGSSNEYLLSGKVISPLLCPAPSDLYGAFKTFVRFLFYRYCKDYKVDFNYAVLTSIYSGDRCDNNVIYYVIKKIINHKTPKLTLCKQQWDYIHINDAVNALYLIGIKGKPGKVYIVGSGFNLYLKDYIEIIKKIINPNIPIDYGAIPYKDKIIPNSAVDISELQKDTGFKPTVKFENGISMVIRDIKGKTKYE